MTERALAELEKKSKDAPHPWRQEIRDLIRCLREANTELERFRAAPAEKWAQDQVHAERERVLGMIRAWGDSGERRALAAALVQALNTAFAAEPTGR